MKRRGVLRLLASVPVAGMLGTRRGRLMDGVGLLGGPSRGEPKLVERWSWGMGQPVHLQVYVADEDLGLEAMAAALREFRNIEAQLTLFDDASDLSEVNRNAGGRPVRVGAHLRAALGAAMTARVHTGGAFDPAVEPLMRAWGFRAPRAAPPDEAALAEARAAVRAATVRMDRNAVTLGGRESRLDLDGIGVGYGLDRMEAILRARGVTTALLDVSGDLLALGAPLGAPGWRVALGDPDRARVLPDHTVWLRDAALATSANTMQTVRFGRTVTGHVLDPHDGREAHALRQVSVLARRGVVADAVSTAALVAGRAAGFEGARVVAATGASRIVPSGPLR